MFFRLSQLPKLIETRLSGSLMSVMLLHPSNAAVSISVTLFGISMLLMFIQPLKAWTSIFFNALRNNGFVESTDKRIGFCLDNSVAVIA